MPGQNLSAKFIDFDLPAALEARPFQTQIEAADTRE